MTTHRKLLVAALLLAFSVATTGAQTTSQPASTGDAKQGKVFFEQTYRCYACHGYDGQTGSPRLVPMSRTQDAFITYVRKPSTAGMPAFGDVPEQNLADVYAYIRSLRPDAPPLESIPLLKDILQQINKQKLR